MDHNQIPQPLFAPASQNQGGDELDLHEVFLEYFINEFDDPLNAYTGGMANINTVPTISMNSHHVNESIFGSNANMSFMQSNSNSNQGSSGQGNDNVGLPTGGIRTAFHTNAAAANNPAPAPYPCQVQSQHQQHQQQQQFGQSQADGPIKKIKVEDSTAAGIQQMHLSNNHHHHGVMLQQFQTGGSNMFQQQPQQQQQFQMGMNQNNNQGSFTNNSSSNNNSNSNQGGFGNNSNNNNNGAVSQTTLPVGVGIKLGGNTMNNNNGISNNNQQQTNTNNPAIAAAGLAAPQFNQFMNATNNAMWTMFANGGAGGGAVTEQAIAERRLRNREHAKRSRVRKKFMLESLQGQVRKLQRENASLRLLVQEHIPQHAMQIFEECCVKNPLFGDAEQEKQRSGGGTKRPDNSFGGPAGPDATNRELVRSDFSLMASLSSGQRCFVLSDPKLPDNPIVYATPAFYEMTGYNSKQVLGRNCRFLQGPGTDRRQVDVIRKAVETGSDATVCLLNYKADGTPFWNQLFVAALRDSDNHIVNYVGVQTEVEPEQSMAAYLEDKVNSVLPLQGKDDDDDDES